MFPETVPAPPPLEVEQPLTAPAPPPEVEEGNYATTSSKHAGKRAHTVLSFELQYKTKYFLPIFVPVF